MKSFNLYSVFAEYRSFGSSIWKLSLNWVRGYYPHQLNDISPECKQVISFSMKI